MDLIPDGQRRPHFRLPGFLVLWLLALGLSGCRSGGADAPREGTSSMGSDTLNVLQELTVLDVLQSDARFSAFTSAVDSANVEAELEGHGPITVFAPTNDVFAAVAGGISGAQAQPRLRAILLHYVADGNVTDQMLSQRDSFRVASLEGERLTLTHNGRVTYVDGVPLRSASITVGNGTVHVLRGALNPPASVPTVPGTPVGASGARPSPERPSQRPTP